jgi:protein TonB
VPAYLERRELDRPRERVRALGVAVLVQAVLAFALFRGLQVDIGRPADVVQRLIAVTLAPTAPPPVRVVHPKIAQTPARKPQVEPSRAPHGGSPGPKPAQALPSVTPVIAVRPSVAPSGGGTGSGAGAGAGSGAAGNGAGGGGGGTDLEQIAGEITPRDYPRRLGNAGVGGRVGVSFTVGVNGRVTACRITHSSGVPELDTLTCRLIQERFRYRPSTDRYGRPIPDQVEGEHDWTAGR